MNRSVFIWSEEGNALALAMRLKREGQPVRFYVHDRASQDVGTGLVDKADSGTPPPGALVIFDAIGHGALGAFLRSRGHPVIGGNPFDVALERDRPHGARIMQEHGIAIPETHPFSAIEPAIRFLEGREAGEQWFVKVSGNVWEASTHNGPAPSLVRYLRWASRQPQGLGGAFELQRRVEGTEVSCEGWFDGEHFVRPFNATIEDKKFLTGNLGGRTGCESNVCWLLDGEAPALPAVTLLQLEDTLRRKRYVGPLDLNCIVDAEGVPHGIEWSGRLGFDASTAYWMLLEDPVGEQLEAFARGELDEWSVKPDLRALTLRVSMPPYPVPDEKGARRAKGMPLGTRMLHDDRITVDDVMLGPDGQPVMAGRDGFLGTVGATGQDMDALREEVLDLARSLDIPRKQYRIDPVERAETAWAALARHGFLDHAGLEGAVPREADEGSRTVTARPRAPGPPAGPEQDHEEGLEELGPRSTRPLEVVIVGDRTGDGARDG